MTPLRFNHKPEIYEYTCAQCVHPLAEEGNTGEHAQVAVATRLAHQP